MVLITDFHVDQHGRFCAVILDKKGHHHKVQVTGIDDRGIWLFQHLSY